MKWLVLSLVIVLASGPLFAGSFSRFHGDDNKLRRALDQLPRSLLTAADIWTHGDLAVVVRVMPGSMGLTEEVAPARLRPWRPAAVLRWLVESPVEAKKIVEKSRFVLVTRHYDRKTCTVNVLDGARIYQETFEEQDATTVEVLCADLWKGLDVPTVPERARSEIDELLKQPRGP